MNGWGTRGTALSHVVLGKWRGPVRLWRACNRPCLVVGVASPGSRRLEVGARGRPTPLGEAEAEVCPKEHVNIPPCTCAGGLGALLCTKCIRVATALRKRTLCSRL